jgi:hypothetical protein
VREKTREFVRLKDEKDYRLTPGCRSIALWAAIKQVGEVLQELGGGGCCQDLGLREKKIRRWSE